MGKVGIAMRKRIQTWPWTGEDGAGDRVGMRKEVQEKLCLWPQRGDLDENGIMPFGVNVSPPKAGAAKP